MTGSTDEVPVPLDVEVPSEFAGALVEFTSPQGSIRHVQQQEAVSRLGGLVRGMQLPLGAWVHADSRGMWPPTRAEYSVWAADVLPDRIALYRGARQRAAKRFVWSPELDCAAMFAKCEWDEETWRRGADNLRPEMELYVYRIVVNRAEMVNAGLIAWHTSSFRGYQELIFREPAWLPDPVAIARVDGSRRLQEL
ncbi:hypothetical protein [Microbacterium sp.]|uniref:hypothetical protein n=1 Tax=Microbacterium sp. TaxID=51671 RepID=UPI0025DE09F0|nr:hypothetical protein [Microbacterium sp.]MBT9607588.1 hypothetical protein [Microbacterium sp.]